MGWNACFYYTRLLKNIQKKVLAAKTMIEARIFLEKLF